jgi:hypothetical protein
VRVWAGAGRCAGGLAGDRTARPGAGWCFPWPNVHPESTTDTAKVNQAFLDGKAEKKLLPVGTQLYKFITKGRGLVYKG